MELTQLYVCNNVWMEETIEGNLSISISSSINISGRISLEPAVVWGSISQSAANGVWRFQWQPPSKYKYPHAQIPACIPIQIHTARHADLVAFLHYWLSKVLNFTDFFCYFQQELLHVAIQTRDNKKQGLKPYEESKNRTNIRRKHCQRHKVPKVCLLSSKELLFSHVMTCQKLVKIQLHNLD